MTSLVAWVALPALLLAVSLGLGLLAARIARVELDWALLAPVGAALAIILAITGYVVGLRGLVPPVVISVLAICGLLVGWRGGGLRPASGIPLLVWLATYGVYIAPVVLTGHWTWLGYNFVNDTSIQLLIAEWLPEHGRTPPPAMFVSTTSDALVPYLSGGYPVGAHALLAALGQLLPVPLEALYQPVIATFAGLGAMALLGLARPHAGRRWAAFVAFAATGSNLFYQYALQGNMKEIVAAAMLMTSAAVAGWSITALRATPDRDARSRTLLGTAAVLALPVSATVHAFSTAGGPYVALVVLLWLILLTAHRLVPSVKALAVALAVGGAILLAATWVTVSTLVTFGETTAGTYAEPARMNDLGHLARPLDVAQVAGIWLTGDYRFAPSGLGGTLTALGVVLVLLLAAAALIDLARRREATPLLLVIPVALLMALVTPRVSPYADAKTYMLLAPAVTLLAALGALALSRLARPLGLLAAAALLIGVFGSNALAYHRVQTAPTERMEAIQDVNRVLAGKGLILFNEPEEFAKNFMADTRVNVGAEAVTPRQSQLRVPQSFAYLWFDLDDLTHEYVDGFPYIVLRRSPVASRPPANFERIHVNDYYEVWKRSLDATVVEHLPLQAVHRVALEPGCQDIRAMADRVEPGQRLVAATAPTQVRLDTVSADRTDTWRPHPFRANMVLTGSPGVARATVWVARPGRYRAWIAGSFGREVEGRIDGRRIGAARGVNTVGQWHDIGTVEVERGMHRLELRRGGGSLAPGDGFAGELGPLVLERIEPRPLVEVDADNADRRLCGRPWDWIERIER